MGLSNNPTYCKTVTGYKSLKSPSKTGYDVYYKVWSSSPEPKTKKTSILWMTIFMAEKDLSDVLITFNRASHIPVRDLISHASDPYLIALLTPRSSPSTQHPPFPLRFRTTTKRHTRDPNWNESWHLGGMPPEGFDLEIKIFDEGKFGEINDRLGVAEISVDKLSPPQPPGEKPREIYEHELKIKKRKARKRAYAATYLVAWCNQDFTKQRGRVIVTIENLGRSTCTTNCPCVLGPMRWSIHSSPLLGRLTGTHSQRFVSAPLSQIPLQFRSVKDGAQAKRNQVEQRKNSSYNLEAYKIQLLGPIPNSLRFTHVEYRPVIARIFSGKGIRGFILQYALHAQHRRVYHYNNLTRYGVVQMPLAVGQIEGGNAKGNIPESFGTDEYAASKQFLDMVHYDESAKPNILGGRLYTYVITLQGEWRFTETGPEFTTQYLTKHSMHSDVANEVAFAGEFFVRRRKGRGGTKLSHELYSRDHEHGGVRHDEKRRQQEKRDHEFKIPEAEHYDATVHDNKIPDNNCRSDGNPHNGSSYHISNKPSHAPGRSRDPRDFVLIIDNSSGTYRPDKAVLPDLQKYLQRNFPGLMVKALAFDDPNLKTWKAEQKPTRKVQKGSRINSSESSCKEDVEN